MTNPNLPKLKQFLQKKFHGLSKNDTKAVRTSQLFAEFEKLVGQEVDRRWFNNFCYKWKSKLEWKQSGSKEPFCRWQATRIVNKKDRNGELVSLKVVERFFSNKIKGLSREEIERIHFEDLFQQFQNETGFETQRQSFYARFNTFKFKLAWKDSKSKEPFYKWRINRIKEPKDTNLSFRSKVREVLSKVSDESIVLFKTNDVFKLLQKHNCLNYEQKKLTHSQITTIAQILPYERRLAALRIELEAAKSQVHNVNQGGGSRSILDLVLQTFENCDGNLDSTEDSVLQEVRNNLRWLQNALTKMKFPS